MNLAAEIRDRLAEAADPLRATEMASYMRVAENGTLPFLGIARPGVRRIVRDVRRAHSLDRGSLAGEARTLWDRARWREEQYAAADLLVGDPARGSLEVLDLHRHMAVTGRWWDHVDQIAHRIAEILDEHPAEVAPAIREWSRDPDLWLRRLAILSQLGRKERVDRALLTDVVEPNLADRDFFVRKAIGWALRDVARHDPGWVLDFVAGHDLSPLSRREALKQVAAGSLPQCDQPRPADTH